ncbi:hypothetical protein ACFLTE_03540 [Bacteroidota bacterium]
MKFIKKSKKEITALKNLIYAISALVIVGACTVLILINPFKKEKISEDKTINKISPEIFQSTIYAPNQAIEKNIKLNMNSKSWKMEGVLPVDSSIFLMNETINFKTKGFLSNPYQIIIYDNKINKVFESEELTSKNFTYESDLRPGVYYWKMQLKKDMIWGGKFFIIHK